MSGLLLGSNVKSAPLTILEQLAFNAQKLEGLRDTGHALFLKNLRYNVRTIPENMRVKFEVLG